MADPDAIRERRRRRLRFRIRKANRSGRMRLSVFRSLRHIHAQIMDDGRGVTLVSASSLEKDFAESFGRGNTVAAAAAVGGRLAGRALAAGIREVVFDRGSFSYHGRLKALAEGVRAGGVNF